MGKCKCGYFFSGSYCELCESGRPVKKTGNLGKRSKRIKSRSDKRRDQENEYRIIRAEYLEKHPICEVYNCGHKSEQVHHKKGRIGKLLTNKKYFLAVCDTCHKYIELHPAWAKAQGYSESRLK